MSEEIRSPTQLNNLRVLTKGYFTDKAAAFNKAYAEGKYQAAVYIKDCADAVNVYALQIGIFKAEDQEWIRSLFQEERERTARDITDSEVIQNQVLERLENLTARLKSQLSRELGITESSKANEAINSFMKEIKEKAPGKRR